MFENTAWQGEGYYLVNRPLGEQQEEPVWLTMPYELQDLIRYAESSRYTAFDECLAWVSYEGDGED